MNRAGETGDPVQVRTVHKMSIATYLTLYKAVIKHVHTVSRMASAHSQNSVPTLAGFEIQEPKVHGDRKRSEHAGPTWR
jgi:hypothetical protein